MSGLQKKVQERGMGNFQPSVCISGSANENPSVKVPLSSTLFCSIVSSLTLPATQNGELVCRLDKRNQNYSNHKSSLFKPLIISEQIV